MHASTCSRVMLGRDVGIPRAWRRPKTAGLRLCTLEWSAGSSSPPGDGAPRRGGEPAKVIRTGIPPLPSSDQSVTTALSFHS
jgi:hypothetical protein